MVAQVARNKKLLGAPGIATGARTLLGAPGRTTSKKLLVTAPSDGKLGGKVMGVGGHRY